LEDYFNPILDWISKRGYPSNEHPKAVGEVYDPILAKSMLDSFTSNSQDWTGYLKKVQ